MTDDGALLVDGSSEDTRGGKRAKGMIREAWETHTNTLEAFLREANLPSDAGATPDNGMTIEQLLDEKRVYDLSQQFEKVDVQNDRHESWSTPAPSLPNEVTTLPHPANILNVSVDDIIIGSADSERLQKILLASNASKSLFVLRPESPHEVLKSLIMDHNSPILSWRLCLGHFLLTSSMSGHVTLLDLQSMREVWSRRDHLKYVVRLAVHEDGEGTWLATAGWDAKIFLYYLRSEDLEALSQRVSNTWNPEPVASITLPSNPESLLFIRHPELREPVILLSRRDSTFLYYYAIPGDLQASDFNREAPLRHKGLTNLTLLGRQNLAPHSNAWIAFTPSALALHPSDPSLIAVATSHVPHMKLIIVRLLLPPPSPSATENDTNPTAPPPELDATTGPLHNPAQAAEARRLLAIQDREDAAIQIQMSTMAPQSPYSTPALAWRPNGTGVWVNGDDGVVRGIEARSGKILSVLKGGHEPGSKVRCLSAGMVEGKEFRANQKWLAPSVPALEKWNDVMIPVYVAHQILEISAGPKTKLRVIYCATSIGCVKMAAPKEKSLQDLSGKWKMQGFNALMRSAIAHAPVYLDISQGSQGSSTKYNIDQSTTANIPAVKEEWITDWEFRESKDPVMGKVKAKAKWTEPKDVEDGDFLAGSWLDEGKEQIEAFVESPEGGWTAHQIWGFEELQSQRMFVRRVVVKKDQQVEKVKLIYDYQG
ncbi:MAG: hypothetical protein Q9162_001767 [Coniocarpon cinnabarinum]